MGTEPDQRKHAAFHEAAHAVVAHWFGWWINPEGVEIDDRQYCGLRMERWANTQEAQTCVNAAGWLAEVKLAPCIAKRRSDEDLEFSIDAVRSREDEPDWGDDEDTWDCQIFRVQGRLSIMPSRTFGRK